VPNVTGHHITFWRFLHKVIFDNKHACWTEEFFCYVVLLLLHWSWSWSWSYNFGLGLDLGLGLNILVLFPSLPSGSHYFFGHLKLEIDCLIDWLIDWLIYSLINVNAINSRQLLNVHISSQCTPLTWRLRVLTKDSQADEDVWLSSCSSGDVLACSTTFRRDEVFWVDSGACGLWLRSLPVSHHTTVSALTTTETICPVPVGVSLHMPTNQDESDNQLIRITNPVICDEGETMNH